MKNKSYLIAGGTEVVLDTANKFRRRILLASSSEVYGKSEAVPFKEEADRVIEITESKNK